MGSEIASIFDLSPAEKLQLVEDLWDDLAATPGAIPIHDWQKAELARRKANLSWYERQRTGLGEEFLGSAEACIEQICRNPEWCPIVHEQYRRALVRRFPSASFTISRTRK
jgi:putative addiction module component (TIGR02574 family)